jgi:hypothetical protein
MQFGNQQDLVKQVDYFKEIENISSKRLEERTNFDLEMIRNWVLFWNRKLLVILMAVCGTRPFCLLIISQII